MPDEYDELLHFSNGVITSSEKDDAELKHALTRADNAQFTSVAGRKAVMRKRQGLTVVNRVPLNNSSGNGPAVVAGFPYRFRDGSTRTNYIVAVTATGNVHLLVDDGAATDITPTASFASALNPDLTGAVGLEMDNRFFLFDRRGGHTSLLGTANVGWGIAPPTGLALATSGSGSMTGDYDVVVTRYDTRTRAESEISDSASVSLTSAGLQVTVDAVAVGDTHAFFRVYLRKPTLGAVYYQVLAGTGYNSAALGFPLYSASPTVSTVINVSDSTLEDSILRPPRVGTRGMPPSAAKFAVVWQRRLVVACGNYIYWSELDLPDAFNPLSRERILSPRGGQIVGLAVANEGQGGALHILTETARHVLVGGADPNSWVIDVADPDIGAVSSSSITTFRKNLVMWAGEQYGPVLITEDGQTVYIGTDRIRENVVDQALAPDYYQQFFTAGFDGRLFFGVVDAGQTRVQHMMVFNLEVGAWESTNWDPMDLASAFSAFTTTGKLLMYAGNHNGQLFRLFQGGNDGVRTGTTSGTFVAGSNSINSITDGDATFDTVGAGLKERRVRLLDSEGNPVTSSRVRITSNTGTTLTLSGNISVTEGETYTYLVGGPDFRLETFWRHLGYPFVNKRFDLLYTELRADSGISKVITDVAFMWDELRSVSTLREDASTELWDTAEWDVSAWDNSAVLTWRTPLMQPGINYRVKIVNPYPDQGFTLNKLGVLARLLTDRYAGYPTLR